MNESHTLARKRGGSGREHREERVDSTVKEGRFQGGKGGQAKRASLAVVEGSMSSVNGLKSSPGRSAESWFHSKTGKTRDEKGDWETKSPLTR